MPAGAVAFSWSMRRTPDVSSTDIRRRLRAGASITGLVPPPVETPHPAAPVVRGTPSTSGHICDEDGKATAMKTDKRPAEKKAPRRSRGGRPAAAADRRCREGRPRRARQEGARRRRARSAATRRRSPTSSSCAPVLNQRQVKAIADARRGDAARRQGPSGPRRRLRPRRLGPHGLLQLHRPCFHAADPRVLFARAAVG